MASIYFRKFSLFHPLSRSERGKCTEEGMGCTSAMIKCDALSG
jgi:hypothetical protein